jgi:Ca2+-binding EF-hand superfamily protein
MMDIAREALADRGRLKAFDADQDGKVTLAELNKGLEVAFEGWDIDKNGAWNSAEAKTANDTLAASDPAMPPVRDWDQSGGVSFEEFAAWNRGRFRRADTNQDGVVDAGEFTAMPKMPRRPPGGMPPGGMPPGGKPPGGGGGMPGGR